MKLQNQTFWEIQLDLWKVRLRGFASSNVLLTHQFEKLKHFDFEVSIKIRNIGQIFHQGVKPGKVTFRVEFQLILLCENVIRRFFFQFPLFRWDSTKLEIRVFDEFSIQNYAFFFIWPDISKYWLDCLIPKYWNAKQHFNFPFSWVKPGNSSYFARYFREFTPELDLVPLRTLLMLLKWDETTHIRVSIWRIWISGIKTGGCKFSQF